MLNLYITDSLRPLIKLMNQWYLKFGVFEQRFRYYAHHYFEHFIKVKSIRFTFKQWTKCCEEIEYSYHIVLYVGEMNEDCKLQGPSESAII